MYFFTITEEGSLTCARISGELEGMSRRSEYEQ